MWRTSDAQANHTERSVMSKDLTIGHARFDAYKDERQGATLPTSAEDFKTLTIAGELTKQSVPFDGDIIKAIAMDIGKELVDYVERMYPDAIAAASSTFRLSLKNHVYNDIMCMTKITDEKRLIEWLDFREKFRRHLKRIKRAKSTEDVDRIMKEAPPNPAMKW